MYKRIFLVMIIVSLVLMLTFCDLGIDYRLSLRRVQHNVIEEIFEGDEFLSNTISYNGAYYKRDQMNLFQVLSDDGDVLLSWNGSRWWGYIDEYYSDRTESPIFICLPRLYALYLNESYDYLSDTFVVSGTDIEVVFSDMFVDFAQSMNDNHYGDVEIEVYSKNYPRIRVPFVVTFDDGIWYLSSTDSNGRRWQASDTFIELLLENGIINQNQFAY